MEKNNKKTNKTPTGLIIGIITRACQELWEASHNS